MEQVADPCEGGTESPQNIKFLRRKLRQKLVFNIKNNFKKSHRYISADRRFHT
jgi:hypothetical protein